MILLLVLRFRKSSKRKSWYCFELDSVSNPGLFLLNIHAPKPFAGRGVTQSGLQSSMDGSPTVKQ